MRNPGGYVIIREQGYLPARLNGELQVINKDKYEIDTFSCYHCNRVVHVPVKADPANIGGTCPNCWKLICPQCVGKGCRPLEMQIEQMEERERILRSYGVI
jgi:hypothetical protein